MPLWPDRQIRRHSMGIACSSGETWFRQVGIPGIATSQAWSAANQVVYAPVYVPEPGLDSLYWVNGATVSGLCQSGIYLPDSEGKPGAAIIRADVIAQSGANLEQYGPTVWLPGGLVYLALAFDNTTSTVIAVASITTDGKNILGNVWTQALASLSLPTIATPVLTPTACKLPLCYLKG